ncbi:ATP synthase subunit s, mitochondrial [Trichonephila clavata]|uniref:ATP synthase subunit s, mitochondrial n=1 Tax=Trichonephila clavata TaxID=2740835 RepID=A0A8X6LLK1_TRICU|nr:ATP synthase subunit s, mitochondrial [Trichonephila clavata]
MARLLKNYLISNNISGRKTFYKWLNTIFNKVDEQRIKEVGADRAAAEWLLRCGASVKWKNKKDWVSDYNVMQMEFVPQNVIEEIDASESCIMHTGFPYLCGLKYLERIKFYKCIYLEDTCLNMLSVLKNSLLHLEVISCGNVSDKGIISLSQLKKLKSLYLYDLPEVKDKKDCLCILQQNLPRCKIEFHRLPET